MLRTLMGAWMMLAAFQSAVAAKGKVLVVLSSEAKITLKNGVAHPTGFFLSELMGPVKALLEAGYEPVFASPNGTRPVMDRVSDSAFWYGDVPQAAPEARSEAKRAYDESRDLCEKLGLCGAPGTVVGSLVARKLEDVRRSGFDEYAAVFFPGGHAPMEDLWKDREVGRVLHAFHDAAKPTALICHAPVALLAAMDDPEGYAKALVSDDRKAMVEKASHWIYRDYTVSVFTTREEKQEEPGEDDALGGYVRFYADAALERAGAFVSRADKWKSQVVVDRELITGQNPFSHDRLAEVLVGKLEEVGVKQ